MSKIVDGVLATERSTAFNRAPSSLFDYLGRLFVISVDIEA